jgi:pyruvate dehydrogenase complex dehydrogenase (E1) component
LRALDFSWAQAAQLFEGFLVSADKDRLIQNGQGVKSENNKNRVVRLPKTPVTPLS